MEGLKTSDVTSYLQAETFYVKRCRQTRKLAHGIGKIYTLRYFEVEIWREMPIGGKHVFKICYTLFPLSMFLDKVCQSFRDYLGERELLEWTDVFSELDYTKEIIYYLSRAAGKHTSVKNMVFVHSADVSLMNAGHYAFQPFLQRMNKMNRSALFLAKKESEVPAMQAFIEQAYFRALQGTNLIYTGSLGNAVKSRIQLRFV